MNDSEDEISIDFGKIGKKVSGFFKGLAHDEKTAEKSKTAESQRAQDDDEISLDFSAMGKKLKAMFSGSRREKAEEDELSVDLSAVGRSLSAYRRWLVPLALLCIALFASVHLRMQPADLHITDDWARNTIYGAVQGDITAVVAAQYPTLPEANRNRIVNEQFGQALKDNIYAFRSGQYAGQSIDIQQQLGLASNSFKDLMRDPEGTRYLSDIDTWFHFRTFRNKVETGNFYDELRDGVPWDTHMLAPLGRPMEIVLHHYVAYGLYKMFSIFRPIAPMEAFFLLPVWIASLAVIPAFFIARRIAGDFGGFFAAVLIAVHPAFLGRTLGGIADTDAYSVTMPLFVAWAFLEAWEARELWKRLALSAVSAFLVGLYSFAWSGWWYIFDFLVATVALTLLAEVAWGLKSGRSLVAQAKEHSGTLVAFATFFVLSVLFVNVLTVYESPGLLGGASAVYKGPFGFLAKKAVATTKLWPNVYTTVAELNPSSFGKTLQSISLGKQFYLLMAAVGIALTLLPRKGKIDAKYAILLSLWAAATVYASLTGIRFVMLLVPAFAIASGAFAGLGARYASRWLKGQFGVPQLASSAAVMGAITLLLILPVRAGWSTALNEVPMVNDAWYDSLTKIRTQSAPDAIINSWWDFGHWFKAMADRRVTFDGASQNTPQAHWIGRVLLTENEDEAVGILRMLDCGSNRAFETLNGFLDDEVRSVDILYDVVVADRKGARTVLEESLPPEQAEEVLGYTHCEPPQDYFITSEDMVGKSGVWAHFGSWDMRRAEMYSTVKSLDFAGGTAALKERFNLPEGEATSVYYDIQTTDANDWIAPWPSYSELGACTQEDDLLTCQSRNFRFTLNRTSGESAIPTQQGTKRFNAAAFVDAENRFRTVRSNENAIPLGALIYGLPYPDKFVLANTNSKAGQRGAEWLPGSMFSRLFYLGGFGLEHFRLFDNRKSITGNNILTWNVSWEGGLKDTVTEGNFLWVDYLGWLDNGTVFDSTIIGWQNLSLSSTARFEDYNTKQMPEMLGGTNLIPGLQQALRGMAQGDTSEVTLPPEEGFTDTAHPLFNQTLHYRLRVNVIG